MKLNKIKSLVIAGLVAAPMFATTVASHADYSVTTGSNSVAYRVHDEFMNDSSLSREMKYHVVRAFQGLHSDRAILSFEASMKENIKNPAFIQLVNAEYKAFHTLDNGQVTRAKLVSTFTSIEQSNLPKAIKWLMATHFQTFKSDAAIDGYIAHTTDQANNDPAFVARITALYNHVQGK